MSRWHGGRKSGATGGFEPALRSRRRYFDRRPALSAEAAALPILSEGCESTVDDVEETTRHWLVRLKLSDEVQRAYRAQPAFCRALTELDSTHVIRRR